MSERSRTNNFLPGSAHAEQQLTSHSSDTTNERKKGEEINQKKGKNGEREAGGGEEIK